VEKGVNTIFQAYSIGVKSGLPTGEIVGYIFMEKKIIQEGFVYCSLQLHNKIPWEKIYTTFQRYQVESNRAVKRVYFQTSFFFIVTLSFVIRLR
jgi:hypothetical protein